jgi:hypothetical protein
LEISQKCHLFFPIFKALTYEGFVSCCFYKVMTLIKKSAKRLTEYRYGHNLVSIQTQHLVSIQKRKEAGNGSRRAFSGRRRAGFFSVKKAGHNTN